MKVKKLNELAKVPEYKTAGSSGFDFSSVENLVLKKGETALVKTGLSFEIPENLEIQVRPRSGLALKHGITVLNSPGTIDSDYRGEIQVILINHGKEDFQISVGDRIAQGVVARVEKVNLQITDEVSQTERGSGGFGSTGKN
ncbi:deoxyuridine 5'-triphosphate nucleotidohydrolase Dut [Thiovulum sp. ES]|nr:deoxyuridine 5'-triphosphate nucleotidohydrolase Dut [Thiovulum sp. ES]